MLLLVPLAPIGGQNGPLRQDVATDRELGIRQLGVAGRILVVTAHPDDENNALISWLTIGRGMEVTLLSLTRGEGGQNGIGEDLGSALGVLRMQELRAARRFDLAAQRFSRAYEFGYSYSEVETFRKWGKEEILKDTVRVIRKQRPHVILTMPRTTTGGGRHHQASALIALEAFRVAGDAGRYPELGGPWQAQRIFEQVWSPKKEERPQFVAPPLNSYDHLLGTSYAIYGYEARASHKCQGTGQVPPMPRSTSRAFYRLVDHVGPAPDPADGLLGGLPVYRDTSGRPVTKPSSTWSPIRSRLRAMTMGLLEFRDRIPMISLRPERLERALLPLVVEARTRHEVIRPGDKVTAQVSIWHHGTRTIQDVTARLRVRWHQEGDVIVPVRDGSLNGGTTTITPLKLDVPQDADRFSLVRWNREADRSLERYAVAENRFPDLDPMIIEVDVRIHDGASPITLVVPVRALKPNSQGAGSISQPVALLPSEEVRFLAPVVPVLFNGSEDQVPVRVRYEVLRRRDSEDLKLNLELDTGSGTGPLVVENLPSSPGVHEHEFQLIRLRQDGETNLRLVWSGATSRIGDSAVLVNYPHIERIWRSEAASCKVSAIRSQVPDAARQGRVGWIEGRGDLIPESLALAGLHLTHIDPSGLDLQTLKNLDVVMLGVRAYGSSTGLRDRHDPLMRWVESGGHLIVFYNKEGDMNSGPGGRGGSPYVPYTARASYTRVTSEVSLVHVLESQHPFLNEPNTIGESDWENWVQERSTYMLETKSEEYVDVLELEEPSEIKANAGRKRGGLVTAKVGDGRWTYVGLTLFRQIPAGVPGAYRLLLNLMSGAR